MEGPKVSVCIPTYNHERYIAQALESALAQHTNFGVEILVGEDCSTDRTREIVIEFGRRHPDRIQLRLAEKNQGGGRNFCDLFARSRGQYVIILEGDDYWTAPHKLQSQADALDAHPDWAMCFHPAWTVYDDGRPAHYYPEQQPKAESTIHDLFVNDFMATSSVLFRNRLFEQLPDWFPDVIVGDWALHILNAEHGKIGFLPEAMSAYRVHQGGVFSCKRMDYKLVTIFKMLTKIDHYFGGKYTLELEENRLRTVRWLVGQMENEAQQSRAAVAREGQLTAQVAQLEACAAESLAQTALLEEALAHVEAHGAALEQRIEQMDSDWQQMEFYATYLECERERLLCEMEPLKSFYNSWRQSPLYRLYCQTVRPWHKLRRYLGTPQTERAEEPQASQQSPVQNAA